MVTGQLLFKNTRLLLVQKYQVIISPNVLGQYLIFGVAKQDGHLV